MWALNIMKIRLCFENINLKVKAGEYVALVGSSVLVKPPCALDSTFL